MKYICTYLHIYYFIIFQSSLIGNQIVNNSISKICIDIKNWNVYNDIILVYNFFKEKKSTETSTMTSFPGHV